MPLAPHTTFGIGGKAAYFVEVLRVEDIKEAYSCAREKGLPVVVLGGGSNVLVPDEGLDAVVIKIATKGIVRSGTTLAVAAGEALFDVVRYAAGQGLGGLEGLAGVPGTLGGAVRGNAGAFGTEVKDVLVSASVFDVEAGQVREFDVVECAFGYRTSYFKTHSGLIVLEATLALSPTEPQASEGRIMHTLAERHKRHIQDIRSAGSFFKNPVVSPELQQMFKDEKGSDSKEGRVPAGWLMDRAGLKGLRVGDAVASEYHTNYFLNAGSATAAQVKELAHSAKAAVAAEFGVELEEEAVVL